LRFLPRPAADDRDLGSGLRVIFAMVRVY
jgi:hypothetical protein